MVGGQTEARAQLSSTIIDYHEPFDQGFNGTCGLFAKAWFKRRILHAPNRIAKLNACKMRRLNQLNATYFNPM